MSEPVGNWSEEKAADEGIVELCNKVKADLEHKSDRTFTEFSAEKYKVLLLVSGSTYVVKVNVGQGEYIFLTIYDMYLKGGNRTHTLRKFEEGKKLGDPIEVPDIVD